MLGMTAILIAMLYPILMNSHTQSDKLAALGVWLIVSFFILVGVEGGVRGISRHKIIVPKGIALFTFTLAIILFIGAGITSA
jgi:hypothetical protein